MPRSDWPALRRLPLTVAAWAIGVFALARSACSFWPVTALAERPGFAAARRYLETALTPDSFVVVWPPEHAAALAALPPALTAADAVPIENDHQRRYLHILVVGPSGFATPPELADVRAEARRRFDAVEVGAWRHPSGDRVLADLRTNLSQARVSVSGPTVNVACDQRRPDGGWDCPGQPPWNNVSPTTLRVDGAAWPCVWAHPRAQHELAIDLGDQILGDRVELEAALADDAATTPGGAPVTLRLEVAGVGTSPLSRTNAAGVARANLPTPRGQRRNVRVVISTGSDGRRHLGVNVRVVETRAASAPAGDHR
ncbi:MAG: hypothetical protein HY903_24985 [Deltaproteobacteria bacterium]|nr:hypothetical protein [Deltaproteobacteria bacterium]